MMEIGSGEALLIMPITITPSPSFCFEYLWRKSKILEAPMLKDAAQFVIQNNITTEYGEVRAWIRGKETHVLEIEGKKIKLSSPWLWGLRRILFSVRVRGFFLLH